MKKIILFFALIVLGNAIYGQCKIECPGDMNVVLTSGNCCWNAAYDARTLNCTPSYDTIVRSTPLPVNGFVGDFDPTNFSEWNPYLGDPDFNTPFTLNGPGCTFGSSLLDFSELPAKLVMKSYDNSSACTGSEEGGFWQATYINFVTTKAGTITFTWDYQNDNSAGAPDEIFGYLINNGAQVNISGPGSAYQHGVKTITLNAGDSFILFLTSYSSVDCGAKVDITKFVFQQQPVTDGIVVKSGPAPGDFVCVNETKTVKLALLNASTVIDSCSFQITVKDQPNITKTLSCDDQIQVSMDESCQAFINADMVLEGEGYGCYNNYKVEIFTSMPANVINAHGNVPNPVTVPGNYVVGIYDASGNNCWGNITVMDKLAPKVDCGVCPPGGLIPYGSPVTNFKGILANEDVKANFGTCWNFNSSLVFGLHNIDVYPIKVTTTGLYIINSYSSFFGSSIAVYNQPVDFSNLCLGLLGGENGTALGEPQYQIQLEAGQTYYVAITNNVVGALGAYSIQFSSLAGSVLNAGLPVYDLACTFAGCNDPNDHNVFPEPKVTENCGGYSLTYVDNYLNSPVCGTKIMQRTYTITDKAGAKNSCTMEFLFTGINLNDFHWPLNWDDLPENHPMLECSDNYPVDANGNPSPSYTGVPDGYNDYCGTLEIFYNDERHNLNCGVKILRKWTVVNDCTGEVTVHTQVIRITDKTAPVFADPTQITQNAKAYECKSDFVVPSIMHLKDACDANPKWWVTTTAGEITGDLNHNGFVDANETWKVINVELGEYSLCYHAIDNCGNETVKCATLIVIDGVPPIPVCEQYKQVSLTVTGSAKVWAKDYDSGSIDNCSKVYFKVLRVNNDLNYDGGCPDLNGDDSPAQGVQVWFDDAVYFCCNDLTGTGDIMVTLRVFDVDPGLGPVNPSRMLPGGDLYGHYNDCWSINHIELKIPPTLSCPPVEVSCEESLDPKENPKLKIDVQTICTLDNLTYVDVRDNTLCGANILRTWTATSNGKTSTCKQKITVVGSRPFDPCTIVFPSDKSVTCVSNLPLDGSEQPTWEQNPCNIVTANIVEEDTLTFVDGACFKILRHWAVVDWCVYVANTGAENNLDQVLVSRKFNCNTLVKDGYYQYTQVLMLTDLTAPKITVTDACIPTVDCNAYDVTLTASAVDSCNTSQKFNWKYIVTNLDTWQTVQYSSNYLPVPTQGVKGNPAKDKIFNVSTASLTLLNAIGKGNYKVIWTVGDGCGNSTSKTQYFTVADKKAPTPIMVDLATAVMQNGMVELKARWFDKGGCGTGCVSSFDNCTPKTGLFFTFTPVLPDLATNPNKWAQQLSQYGKYFFDPNTGAISTEAKFLIGDAHAWYPESNSSSRVWLCNYVESSNYSKIVRVYVWDQFAYNTSCDDGNYDYVDITVNFNHCGTNPQPIISGTVKSYNNGFVIPGMDINALTTENNFTGTTNNDGQFSISVNANSQYKLSGYMDSDYTNGFTTLDLVLIQKHLLSIKAITDPFLLLAADMNKDGKITTSDISSGRNLLLGKTQAFENHSWMSINKNYTFANATKPAGEIDKASYVTVDVQNGDYTGLSVSALKIGDVNMSAQSLEPRSANAIFLDMDNITLAKGNEYEIPVYANNFKNISGSQFVLNLDEMNFLNIQSGAIEINENNYNWSENKLTVSWNDASGINVEDGKVLFTLKVKANKDGQLNEQLHFNDSGLRSEIYVGNDSEIKSIKLNYRNAAVKYALYQNEPNPFTNSTVIGFDLGKDADYTLSIYDVTGKKIAEKAGFGQAGYNKVSFDQNQISVKGLLYYKLESGEFTATKKMVLIK